MDATKIYTRAGSYAQVAAAEVERLRASLAGALLTPGDPEYESTRQVWNGMIDKYPAYIARPANPDGVIASLAFARRHALPVAVRGGGHNVAGLASVDGGLVIDLGLMKDVEVDPAARIVRAGGGATIADVDRASQAHGLAVPLGVVSETGVAGLTLGGGFGWLRNKYGLTSDNLIGAELVTAGGRIVRTSETENPDLLWGLRGGGGNFGVVTRFEYRAYPLGPEVFFTFVFYAGEQMREALQFYREFSAAAPDEVSTLASSGVFPPGAEIFPEELHGRPFIAFVGMYAGSPGDGERAMAPLRQFATPLADFSGVMPYLQAQTLYDEDYPSGELRYYWKSLNLLELPDAAIDEFVAHSLRQPSPYSTTDLWHVGGAVKRFGPEHGAFHGRQAAFLVNPEANWPDPQDDEANIAWVRDFVAAMASYSDGSRYLNFAGLQEEGDAMMQAAFGPQYRRLAELKAKYDPENFFRLNQNVPPAQS